MTHAATRPTPDTTTPRTTTPTDTRPRAVRRCPARAFAQAPEAGTQAAASVAPAMFGDLIGIRGRRVVLIPHGATTPAPPRSRQHHRRHRAAPLHASYKITERRKPAAGGPRLRQLHLSTITSIACSPSSQVGMSNLEPRDARPGTDLRGRRRRPSACVCRSCSWSATSDVEDNQVGDLSLIYKHAFINDRQTGNLLSARHGGHPAHRPGAAYRRRVHAELDRVPAVRRLHLQRGRLLHRGLLVRGRADGLPRRDADVQQRGRRLLPLPRPMRDGWSAPCRRRWNCTSTRR